MNDRKRLSEAQTGEITGERKDKIFIDSFIDKYTADNNCMSIHFKTALSTIEIQHVEQWRNATDFIIYLSFYFPCLCLSASTPLLISYNIKNCYNVL